MHSTAYERVDSMYGISDYCQYRRVADGNG